MTYFSDPYPNEQRYEDIGTGPGGYGTESFSVDSYRKGAPPATADFREQRSGHFQQPGSVLMVYGLDPLRTNADKLFNLMCLYGNVVRVRGAFILPSCFCGYPSLRCFVVNFLKLAATITRCGLLYLVTTNFTF